MGAVAMKKERRAPNRKMIRGMSLLWKAVCIVLACLAAVLATTVFFKIDVIGVSGASHTPSNEIIDASGISRGDNLFLIRGRAAEKNITQLFPYVEEAKIKRRLPGTLIISVTEAEPAAQIPCEEGYWIISASCKLLELSPVRLDGVMEVEGCVPVSPRAGEQLSAEDRAAAASLTKLIGALRASGADAGTQSVDLSRSYSITLQYGGRFTVELGTLENVDYKTEYLMRIVEELDPGVTGRIDVSRGSQADFIPG